MGRWLFLASDALTAGPLLAKGAEGGTLTARAWLWIAIGCALLAAIMLACAFAFTKRDGLRRAKTVLEADQTTGIVVRDGDVIRLGKVEARLSVTRPAKNANNAGATIAPETPHADGATMMMRDENATMMMAREDATLMMEAGGATAAMETDVITLCLTECADGTEKRHVAALTHDVRVGKRADNDIVLPYQTEKSKPFWTRLAAYRCGVCAHAL